jgi:hypothetical protein
MTIVVTAVVGGTVLQLGTYADPAIAEAVAASWARWVGCQGVVMRPEGSPPIIVARRAALVAPAPPVT